MKQFPEKERRKKKGNKQTLGEKEDRAGWPGGIQWHLKNPL